MSWWLAGAVFAVGLEFSRWVTGFLPDGEQFIPYLFNFLSFIFSYRFVFKNVCGGAHLAKSMMLEMKQQTLIRKTKNNLGKFMKVFEVRK